MGSSAGRWLRRVSMEGGAALVGRPVSGSGQLGAALQILQEEEEEERRLSLGRVRRRLPRWPSPSRLRPTRVATKKKRRKRRRERGARNARRGGPAGGCRCGSGGGGGHPRGAGAHAPRSPTLPGSCRGRRALLRDRRAGRAGPHPGCRAALDAQPRSRSRAAAAAEVAAAEGLSEEQQLQAQLALGKRVAQIRPDEDVSLLFRRGPATHRCAPGRRSAWLLRLLTAIVCEGTAAALRLRRRRVGHAIRGRRHVRQTPDEYAPYLTEDLGATPAAAARSLLRQPAAICAIGDSPRRPRGPPRADNSV